MNGSNSTPIICHRATSENQSLISPSLPYHFNKETLKKRRHCGEKQQDWAFSPIRELLHKPLHGLGSYPPPPQTGTSFRRVLVETKQSICKGELSTLPFVALLPAIQGMWILDRSGKRGPLHAPLRCSPGLQMTFGWIAPRAAGGLQTVTGSHTCSHKNRVLDKGKELE